MLVAAAVAVAVAVVAAAAAAVVVVVVVSWTQVVDLCVQSIVQNNFQSQNKIRIN